MAFLLLDGEEFEVVTASIARNAVAGKVQRMFDDSVRSSVRREVDVITMDLFEMTRARYTALLNVVGNGAPIPVAGDAMPAPLSASVRVTGAPYVRDGAGHLIAPTIEITPE